MSVDVAVIVFTVGGYCYFSFQLCLHTRQDICACEKHVSSAKCIPTKSGSLRLSYWNIVPLPLEHCDIRLVHCDFVWGIQVVGHSGTEAF